MNDEVRKADHTYSDILGAPGRPTSTRVAKAQPSTEKKQKAKRSTKGYSVRDKKHEQMRSALDTHEYEP
jgi:hypothetical protein